MKSFGAIFFLLLFSALAPAAPRGYHSPSYHRGGREAAADSLSKSRRIGLSDREVESYPDTAKVEAEQLKTEAAALAAIQRDTANMDAQKKAFEHDTRAINQRINEVEKLVAMDLRAMERNDESRYGSAAGGAA